MTCSLLEGSKEADLTLLMISSHCTSMSPFWANSSLSSASTLNVLNESLASYLTDFIYSLNEIILEISAWSWHIVLNFRVHLFTLYLYSVTFEKVTDLLTQFINRSRSRSGSIWVLHLIKAQQTWGGPQKQNNLLIFWVLFPLKPMKTRRFWFLLYSIPPMRVISFQEEDTHNTVDN